MPKFSVVIPSKDRPQLIRWAVQTVLRQSFGDFELVISDNSDDERTREALEVFDDPRLCYHRSGGLSMPDNWEFAASKATGDYVCVLQDKQVMHFDALERLARVVDDCEPQVVRWEWDEIKPYGLGRRIRSFGGDGSITREDPLTVLRTVFEGDYFEGKALLPIPHYSAIRADLLDEIRRGPTGRLCTAVSPDITLAIQATNLADEITYFDASLVGFSDVSVSNGVSVRLKGKLGNEFIRSLGGESVFCSHVPVKIRNVYGSIYNDIMKLRAENGGRLAELEPDWCNYYCGVYEEIQQAIAAGVDMSPETAAWEGALQGEPESLQAQVRAGVTRQQEKRLSLGRRVRKSAAVQGVTRTARSFVKGRLLRDPLWRCREMVEYVEWRAKRAGHA